MLSAQECVCDGFARGVLFNRVKVASRGIMVSDGVWCVQVFLYAADARTLLCQAQNILVR